MLVKAILVGIIGVFAMLDSRLLGRLNFERPLIVSCLVGIALGDLQKGLMVGAT
ncbi:PTS sugar transporter subunit IIC, partial [Enterococcus cecorum]